LELPYVVSDNRSGSYQATRHLLEQGHKKIACINGAPGMSVSQDRLDGYMQAIRESPLRISRKLITGDSYTKENGYRSIRQLLRHDQDGTRFAAAWVHGVPRTAEFGCPLHFTASTAEIIAVRHRTPAGGNCPMVVPGRISRLHQHNRTTKDEP